MKRKFLLSFVAVLLHFFLYSQCVPKLLMSELNPIYHTELNGSLLLFTYKGIWKSDGTPNGTQKINVSLEIPSIDDDYALYKGAVYFAAYSPTYTVDIWKTDGSEAGTVLVKAIPNSKEIRDLLVFQNKIFFIVGKGSGNDKIWVSDGTAAGTNQFIDLDTKNDINNAPKELLVFNNKLFFWAGREGTNFKNYYVSDGTVSGTSVLNNIGNEYGYNQGGESVISNGKLYYFTGSNGNNTGLWVTDGTQGGTKLVKRLNIAAFLRDIDGILYFNGTDMDGPNNASLYGSEPWRSDGTEAGTQLIKDIYPGGGSSVGGGAYVKFGNKIYFGSSNGVNGVEVWQTDGTEMGTKMLKDIYQGDKSSANNFNAIDYNGVLYFAAQDKDHGTELWKTDGTTNGTTLVEDFDPGFKSGSPRSFFIYKGMLFFETHSTSEENLWYCGNAISSIKNEMKTMFSIYPNPSSGIIQIKSGIKMKGNIDIYNASGIKIKSFSNKSLEEANLDLTSVSKGVYWIHIKYKDGEKQMKLILE